MHLRVLFIIFAILLGGYHVDPARSDEKFIIATGEWPPYISQKMDGYGLCGEITTAVIQEMKMTPEYQFLPWKRCEYNVQKGKAHAAFPYYKTPEREKIYAFPDSMLTSRSVFFYYGNKLDAFDWKTLEDLKPYKIGGTLGYANHKALEEKGLTIDYASDEVMCLKKLKAGRIDIFPLDELVGKTMIANEFPEDKKDFKILPTPEAEYPLYLIFDKANSQSATLIEKFNIALKRVKERGDYDNILEKYGLKK